MVTYKGFEIQVINDPDYDFYATPIVNVYNAVYSDPENQYHSHSKHGIRINKDGNETASALVLGSAGGTGISESSYVISKDLILICCSNQVYALNLPHLSLKWRKQLDFATCFAIYEYEEDFIVHGEIDITRITADGEVKWTFSGADIFVNLNGKLEFEIQGNQIKLVDFLDGEYLIDMDGQLISHTANS